MIERVRGTIARRLLVNFRVDPAIARKQLPPGFELKLADGYAVAGICLIRLEHERPMPLPRVAGISSENAAHRFATFHVESDGTRRECVYIARRHSGSMLNILAGGRAFPGEHTRARFSVREADGAIDLAMSASDGVDVHVRARPSPALPRTSVFGSLDDASAFFRSGSVGYSETRDGDSFDGLCLRTDNWEMRALDVDHIRSTYFDDRSLFPAGSIEFDCGLLMTDVDHEWWRIPSIDRAASRLH